MSKRLLNNNSTDMGRNMIIERNPVADDDLYTDGSEYAIMLDNGVGNPYAGKYHTHVQGEMCPGMGHIHNLNPVIMDYNLLKPLSNFEKLTGQTPTIYGLFINEIHYNPSTTLQPAQLNCIGENLDSDTCYEFFEVFYNLQEPLDLNGYKIEFYRQLYGTEIVYQFNNPHIISGKGFLVFARTAFMYEHVNGLTIGVNLFQFNEGTNLGNITPTSQDMTITIFDSESNVIDLVKYSDGRQYSLYGGQDPWPNIESLYICSVSEFQCTSEQLNGLCDNGFENDYCIINVGVGSSIELKSIDLDNNDGNNWKDSRYYGGSTGLPNDIYGDYGDHNTYGGGGRRIIISEIHVNPAAAGGLDMPGVHAQFDDNFEYLELYNTGDIPINIGSWYFYQGIRFIFPHETVFQPYSRIVVAMKNPDRAEINYNQNNSDGTTNFCTWYYDEFDCINDTDNYYEGEIPCVWDTPLGSCGAPYYGVPWISPYDCYGNLEQCEQIYGHNYVEFSHMTLNENLFLWDCEPGNCNPLQNTGEDIDLRDGECGNYCLNFHPDTENAGLYCSPTHGQACNSSVPARCINHVDMPALEWSWDTGSSWANGFTFSDLLSAESCDSDFCMCNGGNQLDKDCLSDDDCPGDVNLNLPCEISNNRGEDEGEDVDCSQYDEDVGMCQLTQGCEYDLDGLECVNVSGGFGEDHEYPFYCSSHPERTCQIKYLEYWRTEESWNVTGFACGRTDDITCSQYDDDFTACDQNLDCGWIGSESLDFWGTYLDPDYCFPNGCCIHRNSSDELDTSIEFMGRCELSVCELASCHDLCRANRVHEIDYKGTDTCSGYNEIACLSHPGCVWGDLDNDADDPPCTLFNSASHSGRYPWPARIGKWYGTTIQLIPGYENIIENDISIIDPTKWRASNWYSGSPGLPNNVIIPRYYDWFIYIYHTKDDEIELLVSPRSQDYQSVFSNNTGPLTLWAECCNNFDENGNPDYDNCNSLDGGDESVDVFASMMCNDSIFITFKKNDPDNYKAFTRIWNYGHAGANDLYNYIPNPTDSSSKLEAEVKLFNSINTTNVSIKPPFLQNYDDNPIVTPDSNVSIKIMECRRLYGYECEHFDCRLDCIPTVEEEIPDTILLLGDLNEDGSVNTLDVILFVDTFMELGGNVPINQYPQYDINGDGVIDVHDIVMLIDIILADSRTTSAERQKLEEILSRLDGVSGTSAGHPSGHAGHWTRYPVITSASECCKFCCPNKDIGLDSPQIIRLQWEYSLYYVHGGGGTSYYPDEPLPIDLSILYNGSKFGCNRVDADNYDPNAMYCEEYYWSSSSAGPSGYKYDECCQFSCNDPEADNYGMQCMWDYGGCSWPDYNYSNCCCNYGCEEVSEDYCVDSTCVCDACEVDYSSFSFCDECDIDYSSYGYECCDTAVLFGNMTYDLLEQLLNWDCSGCNYSFEYSGFGLDSVEGYGCCDDVGLASGYSITCADLESKLGWDCSECNCPFEYSDPVSNIIDCGGICATSVWIGDGYCDEGNPWENAYFNCEEYNWDGGDCDETATRKSSYERQIDYNESVKKYEYNRSKKDKKLINDTFELINKKMKFNTHKESSHLAREWISHYNKNLKPSKEPTGGNDNK